MKKFLSALLLVLISLGSIASCSEKTQKPSEPGAVSQTSAAETETVTTDGKISDGLPENLDLGGLVYLQQRARFAGAYVFQRLL